MSGHIRKARFNDNKNASSAGIYLQQTIKMQKDFPEYATHGPLNDSTITDEASHTRHIQFPNKQRKKKEKVATSLEVRWFALRSRRHVLDAAGSTSVLPWLTVQSAFTRVPLASLKGSRSSKALHHEDLSPQKQLLHEDLFPQKQLSQS